MEFLDPSSAESGAGSFSSAPAAFTPSVRWCIGIDADDFRLSPTSGSPRFSFHLLRGPSTLLEGYWHLRQDIFCREQALFESSDRDETDADAYPIVALDHAPSRPPGGVVGVVRIFEERPRLWYGGRLGVHTAFRRHNQIGKGLIWKAVTTANAWGCDRFLATVQLPNVRFFRRLHWRSIEPRRIRGVPHHLMEADLGYYTPCREQRPERRAA